MYQVAVVVKNPPANTGDIRDISLIPGSQRFPGGGHGNPLQYSCLENHMDRRAWWATVHRITQSQTWLKQFSVLPSKEYFINLSYDNHFIRAASHLLCVWLFWDPMHCSPPSCFVHGLLQARILGWVAISFSRDLPSPGIKSTSPALAGGFFTSEPPGKSF